MLKSMTFSDCGDSTDPCIIEARTKNSVVGDFSPIKLVTSSSHLEVFKLPFTTSFDEIKAIFGKYGPIARVAMDFKCDESCLECYLTFVSESSTCDALNENERLIGSNKILVRKSTETDTTNGNKRLRTDDNPWDTTPAVASEGWGFSNPSTNVTDSWITSNDFSDGGNRGRRGRGGGGRGGGRSCFNCGEEGHVSWECFKPRGGRGGSRSCFSCGEEGHMSRECPKGPRTRSCFKCGEKGHMSRECPKPREGGGRGRGGGGRGRGGSGFNSSSSNNEWATSSSANNENESKPQTLDW